MLEGGPLTRRRRTLVASSFDGERESAAASLLGAILWMSVCGSLVYEAFQLYAGLDPLRIAAVAVVLLLSVVGLTLLRRGKLRPAAWLTTSALFSVSCVSIGLGGGNQAPGAMTLVILIVMSAMTLERQHTIVWTGLAFVAVSGFAIAETQGWLPKVGGTRPPVELWLIALLHIAAAAFLVSYSAGAFRGVLGALGTRSEELADSEERYAQLVEQLPDAIVSLDAEGTIRECSRAVETLFGYAPSEVLGRPFLEMDFVPPEWRQQSRDVFRSLLAGGSPQLAETQILRRDGTVRWVEANSRRVTKEGAQQLYLVIRDVTARVEGEQRRAALEEQLVEARRLEALGRMAGGVAHDFNNLLVVILSNAELLERASKPDEELLREIRLAGETAAELTAKLLSFAGQPVQEVDNVDVGSALSNVEVLLRRLLRPDVTLEIRSEEGLPPVRGDHTQLEQMIVNLLMNAQQAMPDGGTISVEASSVQLSEADCRHRPGASKGGHVRIAVIDAGCGMDPETVRHIFEPFYSKREGGTGLGLATVHGIVSQTGGHVRVHSRMGEGTRFEVLIPHAVGDTSRRERPRPDPPSSPGAEALVLLVDDEPAVLTSVSRILESQGFRVLAADSLEAARAASEREPGRIDILLSDVLMPGTNGPKLAADLVAARPDMKVLLMSGYTEHHLENQESGLGAVHFISKPFSGKSLAAKIWSVLMEPRPIAQGPGTAAGWTAVG